jgi:hypothetical protein
MVKAAAARARARNGALRSLLRALQRVADRDSLEDEDLGALFTAFQEAQLGPLGLPVQDPPPKDMVAALLAAAVARAQGAAALGAADVATQALLWIHRWHCNGQQHALGLATPEAATVVAEAMAAFVAAEAAQYAAAGSSPDGGCGGGGGGGGDGGGGGGRGGLTTVQWRLVGLAARGLELLRPESPRLQCCRRRSRSRATPRRCFAACFCLSMPRRQGAPRRGTDAASSLPPT